MEFDLVFEGGGAKGMVFVGAMKAFAEAGHQPGRLMGTSAGAITATLLAAGYTADEMEAVLGERDAAGQPVFASFMDAPTAADFTDEDIKNSLSAQLMYRIDIPLVPDSVEERVDRAIIKRLLELRAYPVIFSFVERGGLYVGNAFLEWFRRTIDAKGAYSGMNFAQFHQATGKDLSLVATDTSRRSMLVLNHRTAPNCPVVWGVRMSMSIPFAWHEVCWQREWDPYRTLGADGRTVASETWLAGDFIVDGGALSNFPIDKLISDEPSVRAVMGDTPPDRSRVIGMLIDETLAVANAPPAPVVEADDGKGAAGEIRQLRTVQRVKRLVDTMTEAHDKQTIQANADLVCHLPAKDYGTMEFDMTDERKAALVAAGYESMRAHLAARVA